MELVIKPHKDKAHKVGVIYSSEGEAAKAFEPLAETYKNHGFEAVFEPVAEKVKLTLVSIESGAQIKYPDLNIKPDNFKLLAQIRRDDLINFVHVYWKL